jgi:hypothetical protein
MEIQHVQNRDLVTIMGSHSETFSVEKETFWVVAVEVRMGF